MYFLNNKKNQIFCAIAVIAGLLIRFYYSQLEDYWLDEQISFYVANPNINFNDFFERHYSTDRSPFLFNFFLKIWFYFFGYSPLTGRYLSLIIGFLIIYFFVITSKILFKEKNSFLIIFLSSLNIYLITYSTETRPYILVLFFSLLQIIYFNILFIENKFTIKNIFTFLIFSFGALFSHIFTIIILFAEIFFLITYNFLKKTKIYKEILIFLTIFLFYFFFQYNYIISLIEYQPPSWFIKETEINFFFNLYFNRFFGSKIMGFIFFFLFFYLVISNIKKIFENKKSLFLLVLFIFSYFVPLFYELVSKPIIQDKYIIFVIIPIFLLISFLLNSLKNKKIKKFFIVLVVASTLINQFFEVYNAKLQKPEFTKALDYLYNSNISQISLLVNEEGVIDIKKDKLKDKKILENYLINFGDYKNFFKLFEQSTFDPKSNNNLWLFCYEPLAEFNCKKFIKINQPFIIFKEINFHKIKLLNLQIK